MSVITSVSDTITEKPILVRFGFLCFVLRPTTLAQIYEVGAILDGVDKIEMPKGKLNPVEKMLELYNDVNLCNEIVVTLLFRSRFLRWLFRGYIKRHLTMSRYKKVIEFCAIAFQATFFLTSFTFLKGIKEVTKETNTAEAIPYGDSSEE